MKKFIKSILVIIVLVIAVVLTILTGKSLGTGEWGEDFSSGKYYCNSAYCLLGAGGTSGYHTHPIVTNPDSNTWEIGSILGINIVGTKALPWTTTFSRGFQAMQNLDIYCVWHGIGLNPGTYILRSIVTIDKDHIASGDKLTNISTVTTTKDTTAIGGKNSVDAKKQNLIFQEIIRMADNDEKETTKLTSSSTYKDETRYERRPFTVNSEGRIPRAHWFATDKYQMAIWLKFTTWQETAVGDDTLKSLISIACTDQDKEKDSYKNAVNTIVPEAEAAAAIKLANENNGNKLSSDSAKIVASGSDILVGPFTINYSGSISSNFSVKYNNTEYRNNLYIYQGTTLTSISYSSLANGSQFYIKIPASQIAGGNLKISTTIIDYDLETKIYFLQANLSTEDGTNSQTLIYVDQEETSNNKELDCEFQMQSYGNLEITKVQDTNTSNKLANVKFVIERDGKYLRLKGTSGTVSEKVGTTIININNVASASGYAAEYVTNIGNATRFITDSSGKFTINNLEVYNLQGDGSKYTYVVREVENSNYGFKGNSATLNVSVETDTLTKNTITNTKELGNLTIQKTGANDEALQDVEFIMWQSGTGANGYIKLNATSPVVTNDSGLDITKYTITYVSSAIEATKFKTNSSGKIVINNLEIYSASGTKYNYWLQEITNNNYGYNGMTMSADDVTVTGGNELEVRSASKEIKFDITASTTVTIKNHLELGNIEIQKAGANGTKLENVLFIIGAGTNQYLQLKGTDNKAITTINGPVTINIKNIASSNEYALEYVSDANSATRFITNSEGKITINNLKVNKTTTEKYSYTAYELYNSNYGYGSVDNTKLEGTVTELELNETNLISMTNTQDLGNIEFTKYVNYGSEDDPKKITLENVGFALEISPSPDKNYAYLALYDQNGKLVSNVRGTVTINSQNQAIVKETGIEYRVAYYCTDAEITAAQKDQITIFETDDNGQITVNNLEVYERTIGSAYIYKFKEMVNNNYGFEAGSTKSDDITLESGKTTIKELENLQEYTKISGYAWLEQSTGKSDSYDLVYTEGDSIIDKKLTDLYITNENGTTLNSDAEIKVEIKLYKKDGTLVKDKPDEFNNETGEYTFNNVRIDELANYEVVFIYDGFYYTTIVENLEEPNGSKVKENVEERKELNDKFETIADDSQVISTDGTVNTVEYEKDGHTSTVTKLNFDTTISASTSDTAYDLEGKFNSLKEGATDIVEKIENINMGIVLREQPKMAIGSDIYSVYIDVNQKGYTYYYNGRQEHYENINGDEVGVKFEQENSKNRYTREVYSSDVEALEDGKAQMNVSITYKITLFNQSKTLTTLVKEIENYFDSRYTIGAIGTSFEEVNAAEEDRQSNFTVEEINSDINVELGDGVEETEETKRAYTAARIKLNNGIKLTVGEKQDIYIKFSVNKDAIRGLLSGQSTYHNATEIISYATYYGEKTSMGTVNNEQQQLISDQTESGKLYAGIDKSSQPGNIELKLIPYSNDENEDTTPVLDTSEFEDDTTSAPSLLLKATESRQISGTIFEDKATDNSLNNNEKLGDGIYNQGEKTIAGVKVELYNADNDGKPISIATYSNGEQVTTTTDENGNYRFGYYDEEAEEYVGVLPGRYVIKYTYNNEAYIANASGNKNLNVNDYKSTIITSKVIEAAVEKQEIEYNGVTYSAERWYTITETDENGNEIIYSDAIDDIEYRKQLEQEQTVNNSTYGNISSSEYKMIAYTPVMDIGLEPTATDEETDALNLTTVREFKNIDFGIIERPDVTINIEKQITSLEITVQNGTSIVPKGNPSNPDETMQYVKTGLDGKVYAEIESDLLQGATLKLEYTITAKNECQIDYLEDEYYLYGRGGTTPRTTKITKVVDYLDSSMTLEEGQTEGGIWTTATAQELYDNGLISNEVRVELEEGDYHILVTEAFNEVETGEETSVKLYATKFLATSSSNTESNSVEILELEGGRTIKESIPGNYEPSESPFDKTEPDGDKIDLVITPPTGTTVNYVLYIIATAATFTILVLGIVIIKKKIIK